MFQTTQDRTKALEKCSGKAFDLQATLPREL